jgi:hypothetical protein
MIVWNRHTKATKLKVALIVGMYREINFKVVQMWMQNRFDVA